VETSSVYQFCEPPTFRSPWPRFLRGAVCDVRSPTRNSENATVFEVPSMTELEDLEFPHPFGRMEAFQTSGGTSTLPETFLGKVKRLDYKTIRYPGHCAMFKTMIDLGLASSEPVPVDGTRVAPRRLFELDAPLFEIAVTLEHVVDLDDDAGEAADFLERRRRLLIDDPARHHDIVRRARDLHLGVLGQRQVAVGAAGAVGLGWRGR